MKNAENTAPNLSVLHITRSDCKYNKSLSDKYFRHASEALHACLVCGKYGKFIVERLAKSSK